MNKKSMPTFFALAFVWFTTHFGGGFASGQQVVSFFIKHGWYSVFMPMLSQVLLTIVFYYVWKYSFDYKLYDYRSWTNSFYKPVQGIMSNVYDIIYNTVLIVATAVAFATGGATIEKAIGTPYLLNTIILAGVMFVLTIFGADLVRKAATGIAIAIIAGMLIIFVPNVIKFWPNILKNIGELKSIPTTTGGFWGAAWKALVYAAFQACAIGAYVSHAETVKEEKEIKKAVLWGLLINGGIITITTLGIIAFYGKEVMTTAIPTLVVVKNGVGSAWMTPIVSMLILLGAISTGVNLIFGMVNRIVSLLGRNESVEIAKEKQRNRSIITSLVYIILTWCVAQFGLIPLVAKGYAMTGTISIAVILIPILIKGIIGWKKNESGQTTKKIELEE